MRPDDVRHFLLCPVLWNIVGQVLGYSGSVFFENRLLLVEPTYKDLLALTIAHSVYHSLKNDIETRSHVFGEQAHVSVPWSMIQTRAVGFAKGVFAILRT